MSLTVALEDYLNDPNFDVNREEYRLGKESRSQNKTVRPSMFTKSASSISSKDTSGMSDDTYGLLS